MTGKISCETSLNGAFFGDVFSVVKHRIVSYMSIYGTQWKFPNKENGWKIIIYPVLEYIYSMMPILLRRVLEICWNLKPSFAPHHSCERPTNCSFNGTTYQEKQTSFWAIASCCFKFTWYCVSVMTVFVHAPL